VPDRSGFHWTPDQLQRYSFLREAVIGLGLGRPVRLLDVGGAAPNRDGSLGRLPAQEIFRASAHPEVEVTVLDRLEFEAEGYIKGDGRCLPFPDGAFDVVSAMDVLEHVPAGGRPAFLKEMVRVSSGLVIVAGPRADDEVLAAERSVAKEIRDRYGIEHVQLAEHEANGLISDSATRETLEASGAAVTTAGYGSLASWTESQGLRSRYLMRRDTPRVLETLDAYLAARDGEREFEPPFYRTFWLASKTRERESLDDLAGIVLGRLKAEESVSGEEREKRRRDYEEAAAAMEARGMVSAVVVSKGGADALQACLRHLLTQRIEADLEIAVWEAGSGVGLKSDRIDDPAKSHPSVRFVGRGEPERGLEELREIVGRLRGDAILLVDESVRLHDYAVANLYAAKRHEPGVGVWAWRVSWKRFFTLTRLSRHFPWLRGAAGRLPRFKVGAEVMAKPRRGWIFGRCLMFTKEALIGRLSSGTTRNLRGLFLWP